MTDDDRKPLPLISELLGPGPFRCQCGVEIAHWGSCSSCYEQAAIREHEQRLRSARESIPPRFRWARFGSTKPGEMKLADFVHPDAIRRVAAIRPPLKNGIALVGESGAGKTSIACAFLRRIHDGVKHGSPSYLVDLARSARFVAARHIEEAAATLKRFGAPDPDAAKLMAHVHAAAILVVDNVEPGSLEGAVGKAIMDRHDAHRTCTIITTWMPYEEAARSYGGGWARRSYELTVELPLNAAKPSRGAA